MNKEIQIAGLRDRRNADAALVAIKEMRNLLLDISPSGDLANEHIIRGRIQRIHDRLAKVIGESDWMGMVRGDEWRLKIRSDYDAIRERKW